MKADVYQGLALALLIELVTLIFRFYFGMESTRDTAWIGQYTLGLRIHHGYIGGLMLLALIFMNPIKLNPGILSTIMIVGIGLLVSDLLHHFLVLWLITGSPQFDLVYP